MRTHTSKNGEEVRFVKLTGRVYRNQAAIFRHIETKMTEKLTQIAPWPDRPARTGDTLL